MADPERFDADPTFQADADPDPALDPAPAFIVSKVFQNLSWVISQQECGRKGEG